MPNTFTWLLHTFIGHTLKSQLCRKGVKEAKAWRGRIRIHVAVGMECLDLRQPVYTCAQSVPSVHLCIIRQPVRGLSAMVLIITFLAHLLVVHVVASGVQKEDTGLISDKFTAAVYAHRPIFPLPLGSPTFEYARSIIQANLDLYEKQAKLAAEQGARIIVFPEDGIHGPMFSSRKSIFPYLEEVPDPGDLEHSYNPCELFIHNHTLIPVQYGLSCMARNNKIYIVANSGTLVLCNKTHDPDCPRDGHYQYNTNLVFDTKGDLVGRYHKNSLFYEDQFDTPASPEYTIVETPFGKFGTFVCFDVLFKKPALDLVEQHAVDGILFPTAWHNEMPFMQAVAFHEAWAVRMGVNFLSAEIHIPMVGFVGSGIYAGSRGAIKYSNDRGILSEPELIVAEMSVKPAKPTLRNIPFPSDKGSLCGGFTALMEGNLYTFSSLCENEGTVVLNVKNTQCHLSYKFAGSKQNPDLFYALAAFDGLHSSAINSYIQVCAVVACSGQNGCGTSVSLSTDVLSSLTITGQFSTPYIFPSVLFSEYRVNKSAWNFAIDVTNQVAELTLQKNQDVFYESALYGRVYELDDTAPSQDSPLEATKFNFEAAGQKNEGVNPVLMIAPNTPSHHNTQKNYWMLNWGLALTTATVVLVVLFLAVRRKERRRTGSKIDRSQYIRL